MTPSTTNFHHVEIDNIGRRRRNVRPPGGESSDIFNLRKQQSQPRNIKFYNKSNIFYSSEPTPVVPRLSLSSISHQLNTKQRLFGPPDEIKRKSVDRMKSSIFSTGTDSVKKLNTNAPRDRRNPITGEACLTSDHVIRTRARIYTNPITGEGHPDLSACSSPSPGSSFDINGISTKAF